MHQIRLWGGWVDRLAARAARQSQLIVQFAVQRVAKQPLAMLVNRSVEQGASSVASTSLLAAVSVHVCECR